MTQPSNTYWPEARVLMDSLPVGVFRMNNDTARSILFVNTCLCGMLSYQDADTKSLNAQDVFVDPALLRPLEEKALKDGSVFCPEIEVFTKTKKRITCSLSLVALFDHDTKGKTLSWDGILQDISGAKRVEKDLKE
ncbi:MAG: PAS domain-containing protein, partial [Candidatus Omnitrophica bacterium]|nr:PAS domain-containing protein [Candidatus Omnitrophota bacterium]